MDFLLGVVLMVNCNVRQIGDDVKGKTIVGKLVVVVVVVVVI